MIARTRCAFSLIELVIVVVIIGIIAAIAIPRMSRGAAGANSASLKGSLAVLRNAIDLYATEHGGSYPTVANFVGQLTTYSDAAGTPNATKTGAFIYGPYIREIPKVPVGPKAGSSGVAAGDAAGIGWLYTVGTGNIVANTGTDTDDAGVLYNTY